MAVISSLVVSLSADTAKFDNGLKKAKKTAGGFGDAAGKAMSAAAAATGVLTIALIGLTKQSLALVDQQRKSARTLGTSQAIYSGLALAAGIAGSSAEGFTKALKKQAKAIVDASDGLMTQKRAFERLGLSAKDLIALPVEEQFKKITSALGEVENSTLKVGIASDIFGSKNADLINIIDLGADGIDYYIKKVKELGVALTDNQTSAIEESNDAVLVMQTSFKGLGNQLAARVAPLIKTSAEVITTLTSRVTSAIPEWAAWAAAIFGVERNLKNFALADFAAELDVLSEKQFEADREFKNLLNVRRNLLASGQQPSDGLVGRINDANEALVALGNRFKEVTVARDKLLERGEVLTPDGTGGGVEDAPDTSIERRRAAIEGRLAAVNAELQKNFAMFAEWEAHASAAFKATRTPAEALRLKIIEIQTALRENPFFDADLAQRTASNAVDAYLDQMERLKKGTDDLFMEMSEFQKEAFGNMQDILSEFLFDPWDDGLDGMLKSFVDMLRRMVAQLLATKILEYLFGLTSGSVNTGLGIGNNSGIMGPPAAIGGNRAGGRPLLTGENGPELFTPGATGAIRPLGAVAVTQENHFGGGGGLDIATLIPILEENNKKVKGEILDAFDRGAFA